MLNKGSSNLTSTFSSSQIKSRIDQQLSMVLKSEGGAKTPIEED